MTESQNKAILAYLKAGNTITAIEALARFQCMRLAARIKDLRDMGYNIIANTVSCNGKRFAEYRIAA